jgi:hypothetical protein
VRRGEVTSQAIRHVFDSLPDTISRADKGSGSSSTRNFRPATDWLWLPLLVHQLFAPAETALVLIVRVLTSAA